jgi:hypothetical protein
MPEPNLLEQFVATFEKFDDMMSTSRELDPVAWELKVGEPDEYGWIKWATREDLHRYHAS